MSFLYIIELSWANLMNRKIRSILTVAGAIIGIMAITFLFSLGYGFQEMTTSQIASSDALSIFETSLEESDIISISDEHLSQLKNLNYVEKVEAGIILAGKAGASDVKTGVVINGFSNSYLDLTNIRISRGARFADSSQDKILASTALLKLLNISADQYAKSDLSLEAVLNQSFSPSASEGETRALDNLKISGIIDDEKSAFVIVPFDLIKEQAQIANYNTTRVKVKDESQLADIRRQVEAMGFGTNFIGDTISQINTFFAIFRYIIGGFGFVAMVVAILGMFNTLTVSLLERTREIGVLKSNGATRKDIWRIFISEALIISVIGGVIGLILGVITGELVNFVFNIYAQKSGAEAVDFFYTPLTFVLSIFVFVIFIGFLTGLYPAKRASKIKVLDALKYE